MKSKFLFILSIVVLSCTSKPTETKVECSKIYLKQPVFLNIQEKSNEVREPNTGITFICTRNSTGSQYADLSLMFPDGGYLNYDRLKAGVPAFFKSNGCQFRLYVINVTSSYEVEGAKEDVVKLKLEQL